MKKKIGVVFILSLLALLFACVSKPLQIPLKDKNFYRNVHSIGIYVCPSGNEQYDRILYNVLSLDAIAAGYDVVNMRSPSESGAPVEAPVLKGSHKKVLNKIQSGILNKRIDNSHVDALYIVSPKWKTFYMYYKGKRSRQVYETENMSLKLSITTLDASTLEILASSTKLDTTDLFFDEITAKRFDKAENIFEAPVYPEPVNVLIQKSIDRTLGRIPTTTAQDSVKVMYSYPVVFYVDQRYRDFYKQWRLKLKRRLLYVSDIFRKQFNVSFYVEEYREWYTGDLTSLNELSSELWKITSNVRDKFIIGITLDETLMRNWTDKNFIGISLPFANHLVIKDAPAFPGATRWDAIEEALIIAHELGHSFGAPHVFDPFSIMYPLRGESSYLFDSFSSQIIQLNFPQKLRRISLENYYSSVSKIIENYMSSEQKNMEMVPLLSGLLSSEYLLFANLDTSAVNTDYFQFSDSSIFYAIEGYRDYEKAEWKTSLSKFEKAIELNSEMPELFAYCSRICDRLEDQKKSEFYRKKAEEMGYFFTDM